MVDSLVLHVLLQLLVIIVFARLGGVVFQRLGQPAVCGEIAAGLILGPSVFGGLFPGVFDTVFSSETAEAFTAMSQLGLVLLLFLIGLDFDFDHIRGRRTVPLAVSITGVVLPFGLGVLVGALIQPSVAPEAPGTFPLFVGLAVAITALPVLGRILIEFRLNTTPLGVIAITSAALDDVVGWTLLALITGLESSGVQVDKLALMVGETAAYAGFLVLVGRPLLKRWARAAVRRGDGQLTYNDLAILFGLLFASAIVTELIGIFAIFGAFLLGTMLYDEKEFREAVKAKLGDFVAVFFIPIFFTYTGLRTDIGSMGGQAAWIACGAVLLVAIVGKLGGCTLAARAAGLAWRDSLMVGVLMNTRALMALIVINAGLDAGILNRTAFFILVLMAVVTTYMTGPLLRRLRARAGHESLSHPAPAGTPVAEPA